MPFNIDAFKTNIEDAGYLTTNKFTVYLNPPPILGGVATLNAGEATTSDISRLISFRADNVRAPGINVAALGINRYGVGPVQKQPFSAEINDIAISMVSDGNGDIWQFWHNWIRNIFEFTGTEDINGAYQVNGLARYHTYYKQEYATTIVIEVYDQYGNDIQKIDLIDAFPVSLSPVNLSWGNNAELLRINVGITYKEYMISSSSVNDPVNQPVQIQQRSIGISQFNVP